MFKHSWLRFTIQLIAFLGFTSAIPDSPRKERLLGAKLVTRDQINSNFQGSASIAVGYSTSVTLNRAKIWAGIIIEKESKNAFLTTYYEALFTDVCVSELTAPYESGGSIKKDDEGELYVATSQTASYGPVLSVLSATMFGPLQNSKAVVATLPPDGSKPPPPETKGCVVYGFRENTRTDGSDPTKNTLGYLPLIVLPFQKCKDRMPTASKDDKLQFCGTLDYPKQPYCHDKKILDFPMIVACPPGTLRREYKKENNFIKEREQADKKCFLPLWWWWWCTEEDIVVDLWIIVGIANYVPDGQTNCDPSANNDLVVLFTFMGNLES